MATKLPKLVGEPRALRAWGTGLAQAPAPQAPAEGGDRPGGATFFDPTRRTPNALTDVSRGLPGASAPAQFDLGWVTADEREHQVDKTLLDWSSQIRGCAPLGLYDFDLGAGRSGPPVPIRTSLGSGGPDVNGLLQAFKSNDGGKGLLTSPKHHVERSLLGFVKETDWKSFAKWYEETTGSAPNPEATAHPLWVRSGGQTRAMFVVRETGTADPTEKFDPINVVADMRASLGFRDADHETLAATDRVLHEVDAELAKLAAREEATGTKPSAANVRAMLQLLLRGNVNDPRLSAKYKELSALGAQVRSRTKEPILPLQWYGPEVERVRGEVERARGAFEAASPKDRPAAGKALQTALADLDGLLATDDVSMARQLESAQRRAHLRGVIDTAPPAPAGDDKVPPPWFQALKAEVGPAVTRAFEYAAHPTLEDLRFPAPEGMRDTLGAALARGNSAEQLTQFICEMMDALADKAMKSEDPLVKAQWAARRMPMKLLDEVIREQAQDPALGFAGVENISAGGRVLDMNSFGKILEDKKLVLDPFFTINQSLGPKGRTSGALAWLYLAKGVPGAADLYSKMGAQMRPLALGTDCLVGDLMENNGRNDWPLSRMNLTPLLEMFLGAD